MIAPRHEGTKVQRRMRFGFAIALTTAVCLLASIPIEAHHSFAAEYDANKPVKLTGTVTKIGMANPHSWIYLDVKDESGKTVNWKFEMAAPDSLIRRGFTIAVKVGMQVTIEGFLAKDASPTANGQKIHLPGGSTMIVL